MNDASAGVWTLTSAQSTATVITDSGANQIVVFPRWTDNFAYAQINVASQFFGAMPDAAGLHGLSRVAASGPGASVST